MKPSEMCVTTLGVAGSVLQTVQEVNNLMSE